MKPINLPTIIRKYKGVFSSAVLSLIIHLSMFLAIPSFSLIAIDKSEDSDGQFLSVEMINVEGEASETAGLSGGQEKSEVAGKDDNEKGDPGSGDKSISGASPEGSGTMPASGDKDQAEPTAPAIVQALAGEEQNAEVIPTGAERDRIESSTALSSRLNSHSTEEATTGGDKSEMSEGIKAAPDQLTRSDVVQPTENPVGLVGEQGPEAVFIVKEDAADQLFVSVPNKENVIQTPAEAIKYNQIADETETEMNKETPVARSEPRTPDPEQPAPMVDAGEAEIKVESQKGDTVEESIDDKEVKVVKEAETQKSQPIATDMARRELQAAKYPQESDVTEKKKEPDIEPMIETEEKSIAKNEPSAQKMPVPDKRPEERKVEEKRDEPAKIIEQNVESPAKKKKRIIPFHKMVEPEKETTIGIPLGRPSIKFTAPAKKKVSSRVQSVSGRAQGKGVTRVTLTVNGDNTTIPVQNGRFLWDTVLRDGKNTISGTVWDTDGRSATDTVTVEVLTSKDSFRLYIDEPGGELESPVAMVKGRVDDATVDTVRLILNGELFETAVEDGYFEKTVLFKEKENTLQAEAVNSAGRTARTEPLKVLVRNPLVADILIRLVWNDTEVQLHPGLSWKERSRLDDERAVRKDANIVELMSAWEGYAEKIFSVREAGDGAYALKVSGGRGTDCKLVVSLNSSKKVRVFEKRLMEGEEWVVGRFLMPEGVFWDEDELFSGRIEGSDSMTKYKSSEGVTWKELK